MFRLRHQIRNCILAAAMTLGVCCDARSPSPTTQPASPPPANPFLLGDSFDPQLPIEYLFARTDQSSKEPGGLTVQRMVLMPGTDAHHYIRVVLNEAMLKPREVPATRGSKFSVVGGPGYPEVWRFDQVPPYPDDRSCILRQSSEDGKHRVQVAIGRSGFFLSQERNEPVARYRGLDIFLWLEFSHALNDVPREELKLPTAPSDSK